MNIKKQKGQSIIETMVAIFVLVMGITAALGLASYSLSASTNITKQIIGTGLAREGLESVKNMRDTNWLKGIKSTDCPDYQTGANTATCYKSWLNPNGPEGYNLFPGGSATGKNYTLSFDKSMVNSDQNFWTLTNVTSDIYGLDIDPNAYSTNPLNITSGRFYQPSGLATGNSDYYRRVNITLQDNVEPYQSVKNTIGGRLLVTSDVWWKDKKCPAVTTWEQAKTACRVRLQMYLVNWRVY